MPPFEYRTPVNPYAPSVGEILLHSGDAAARAAEVTAAARARAAEVRGNAWGGAVQQSAQQIGAIPGQLAQQKRVAQEDQLRTIEVQKAQAGQKVGALITANTKTTPDGHLVYDVDGFANAAKADPTVAPWAHEPLDAMTRANDTYQQFKEGRFTTKQAALQQVFAKTNEAGGTTDDLQVIAAPLMTAGIITKDDIAPVLARLGQIPDAAARSMFLRGIGGVKAQLEKAGKDDVIYDVTPGSAPRPVVTGPTGAPTAEEAMQQAYVASLKKPAGAKWEQLTPDEMAAYPTWKSSQGPSTLQSEANWMLDGKPTPVLFNPKTGVRSLTPDGPDVSAKLKPIPTAAQVSINAGDLTDVAIDKAAALYNTTHTLPPGYGAAAIARNTKIMNRAGELDPSAALAANAATYKADSANLTKLQTTEGALSAFENAAGKNIKQFVDLSAKLPDTGVPWLNTPVRLLDDKLVGSEWLPAVQAARKIALREVARVTNDPGLKGQLTDSARADVNEMADGNATIAQMKRVFPVLLQDMANVHSGMNEEIGTVKDRLKGNPAATTATPAPANVAAALKGVPPGKHTLSDGSVWLTDASGNITKAAP